MKAYTRGGVPLHAATACTLVCLYEAPVFNRNYF